MPQINDFLNKSQTLVTSTVFANPATATDTVLVAGIAGKKLRVHSVFIVAAGANSVFFKSDTTALTASSALAANGGLVLPFNEPGWFVTNAGQGLVFTTSAIVATGVTVTYTVE